MDFARELIQRAGCFGGGEVQHCIEEATGTQRETRLLPRALIGAHAGRQKVIAASDEVRNALLAYSK